MSATFFRRLHCIVVDLAVLAGAFELAYLLRFDFAIPSREIPNLVHQLPVVVLLQFSFFVAMGTYRFIWRYIGLSELKTFLFGAVLSAVPLLAARLGFSDDFGTWRVPLSVIVFDTFLAFGGMLAVRVARRVVYEQYELPRMEVPGPTRAPRRILLIGAGRAGRLAADEIQRLRKRDLLIEGFIDDDRNKQNAVVQGVKVLGAVNDLPAIVRQRGIDHVVISVVRASRQELRRIIEICEQIPVKARIIPTLQEVLTGSVALSRTRDVQIEDLLGRAPVALEGEAARLFIAGKVVMVTGAGGSIGSELARQVARHAPANLLLVERAEFALFNVHEELRQVHPTVNATPVVADVGDDQRMAEVFGRYRPHVVIHAAAHKHVPLMEANPTEAVSNNALATYRLGELAAAAGADVFVLISTDKAVRPSSIMGASKRVAEMAVQSLNDRFLTRYVAVRFGNVIGSSGSVIPIFRSQIEKGGPVTVTHAEMTRYFMTIPEAAQLVLEAATIGAGGEIFVLDMGEPVKILDLAKDIITLSGLRPYEDIDIVCTGIRPGEKLHEELNMSEELMTKTRHPKIFIGKIPASSSQAVTRALDKLEAAVLNGDEDVRRALSEIVPDARLERAVDIAFKSIAVETRRRQQPSLTLIPHPPTQRKTPSQRAQR